MHIWKKVVQIGLLGLLLFVSGCQGNDQNNAAIDDAPLDRRIGIIKSLGGIITDSQGTHVLQLDDGDTVLLKSVSINLDDEKYLSKMVEVRGVIMYSKSGKPLMEVQNIDILDQNYIPKDEKESEWALYENSEFGWAIKYKSGFEKKESGSTISFSKKVVNDEPDTEELKDETYEVSVTATAKDEAETLEEYLDIEGDDEAALLAEGLRKSRVGTQSLPAYKKQMDQEIDFYVEGGDYFYDISFEGSESPDLLAYENVFYEMVAGFSLDNPGESSSMMEGDEDLIDSRKLDEDFLGDTDIMENEPESVTTPEEVAVSVPEDFAMYESDTFGFGISYPKSWYFAGTPPTEAGSVRHYDFSNEEFDDDGNGNSIVSLDIFNGDATEGSAISVNGNEVYKSQSGGEVSYYVLKDGKTYKVEGSSAYESTMLEMISSIE